MKPRRVFGSVIVIGICGLVCASSFAQQTVAQQLAYFDEKLSQLRAAVDDLEFRQKKMQEQLEDLQAQVTNLRSRPSVSASDLQSLETRIQALDAAREKDKDAILTQLAKELATLSSTRATPTTPARAGAAETKEHVVQKGETLAVIAKTYSVTVADLVRANGLADPDEIKVGQKLIIPK